MSSDPSSPQKTLPMLELPSGQLIPLTRPLTIGRAADNDVVLRHPSVSRYHCAISLENGSPVLTDRQSSAGTVVNGRYRVSDSYRLHDGDRIQVGGVELGVRWASAVADATQMFSTTKLPSSHVEPAPAPAPLSLTAVTLYLRRGTGAPKLIKWSWITPFTIGRAEGNSLVVADDFISRRHAEILDRGGTPSIRDLGSANGTFVNHTRLTTQKVLAPGDVITAGPLELIYDPVAQELESSLVVLGDEGEEDREYPLQRPVTTIGQAPGCDIVLSLPPVAPEQARIERFFSDFWLFPIEATAPVLINNRPITGPTLLHAGDRLQFGTAHLLFRQSGPEMIAQPAQAVEVLTLRQVTPFTDLDEATLQALVQAGNEVTFEAGTVLLSPQTGKKTTSGALYVLLAGEATVRSAIAGDWDTTAVIMRLSPGDYCGERSLVYGQPYPYRVEATSPGRAFRLQQKDFEKLRARFPFLSDFFADKVVRQGLVKYLREVPLLALVPPARLAALASALPLRSVPAGDVVVRRGEVCPALFVVASGSFRVTIVQQGTLTTLTYLTEGKYVGEQIAGVLDTCPYTVVADTAGEVYTLARAEFSALVQEMPGNFDFGQARVPASVILQRTPPFDEMAPELVAEATRSLRVKYFRAGETIIYQDDPVSSAFYIIATGKVEVLFRSKEGEERVLAELSSGQCFGEAALLTNSPRNATVRAIEDCQLLALYRREFNEIVNRSPLKLGQFLGHTFNARFRPKHIDNVETFEQHSGGSVSYILRNPERDTYVNLSPEGLFVWNLLDGERTLNDIAAAYYQRYRALALGPVIQTILQLQQLGFLGTKAEEVMKQFGEGADRSLLQRAMGLASTLLTGKMELKGAHRYFEAAYRRFFKVFYTRPALILLAVLNLLGLAAFVNLLATGVGLSSLKVTAATIIGSLVMNTLITVTHELGHGVTLVHIGRRVLGAGISFLYVGFAAFVNTTDSWMASKGQRLAVTAGGLVVTTTEAALCAIGVLLVDDPIFKTILTMGALSGYFGFLANINPLWPSDGYNFLMDVVAIPDLRSRAFHYLFSGQLIRDLWRRAIGDEHRGLAVFGLFTVLFMVFTAVTMGSVVSHIATAPLRTFLPEVGVILVEIAVVGLVIGMYLLAMLKEAGFGSRKAHA